MEWKRCKSDILTQKPKPKKTINIKRMQPKSNECDVIILASKSSRRRKIVECADLYI